MSGRRRRSQSKSRDAVSFVFSFFLSIALLGVMVIGVVYAGMLSRPGFMSLYDGDYYTYMTKYIEDQAHYYTLPTGIDPSVLDNVFSVAEVKNDADNYVIAALYGNSYEPDVTPLRNRIRASLQALYASGDLEVGQDGSIDEVAASFEDDIANLYTSKVEMAGLDQIVRVRALFMQYLPVVLLVLVAFGALLVFFIMHLHHYVHRSLRYVVYALGGAALMGCIVPCAVLVSGYFNGLGLSPQYFYHFVTTAIARVLELCMIGSGLLLVLAVVLAFVVARLRKRDMRRHH